MSLSGNKSGSPCRGLFPDNDRRSIHYPLHNIIYNITANVILDITLAVALDIILYRYLGLPPSSPRWSCLPAAEVPAVDSRSGAVGLLLKFPRWTPGAELLDCCQQQSNSSGGGSLVAVRQLRQGAIYFCMESPCF